MQFEGNSTHREKRDAFEENVVSNDFTSTVSRLITSKEDLLESRAQRVLDKSFDFSSN